MDCMGLLGWLPSCPAVVSRVVLVTSHQLGWVRSAWRQSPSPSVITWHGECLSACRDKAEVWGERGNCCTPSPGLYRHQTPEL